MAIKVVFPANASSITVAGLYQWDYGQALEIECPEIGSEIVEIHFACHSMTEAIVRPCTFANGIGTVIIPDRCLEQTSAITAWIYRVDGAQGHTIKTITLPLTSRTRPGKTRDIPAETVDKYGELIEQVNVAVEALEAGTITAANALNAKTAESATTAQNAVSASYATSAGSATTAGSAERASRVYVPSYLSCEIKGGYSLAPDKMNALDIYLVVYQDNTNGFNSGIFSRTAVTDGIYRCSVGLYDLHYLSSGAGIETINLTAESIESANINGTLKFYKLGGVSG